MNTRSGPNQSTRCCGSHGYNFHKKMLTLAQQAAREGKVTASFVPALIAGDEDRILAEWRKLIGDPSWQAEDFDENWPVQLGSYLEPFILDWHERRTGQPLIRRGEVAVHPELPWLSCTLDAWRDHDRAVLDAKVSGAHRSLYDIQSYYTPQLVIQKLCTGADRAALILVHGSAAPQELEVFLTSDYEARILDVVKQFWSCVETMTPPVPLPNAPIPPERWRKINLELENTNWGVDLIEALDAWQGAAGAAAAFDGAKKRIKNLVPDDVGEVRYRRFRVLRARNNAITIKVVP